MSQRLRVANLQASRIPASLNICPEDERFYQWLNEAENLMLGQGRWWGSVQEAQFCVLDGCITWPRQVATVERIAVCGQPIPMENGWYGYTRLVANLRPCPDCGTCSSSGARQCACGHYQGRMREDTVASFATTIGANKVIRSYAMSPADAGKTIIYQGRDANGVWVRSTIDGTVQDGEQVTLNLPFVDTVTVWGPGSPTAVVKEVTTNRVLVYEYDTVTALERQLAEYEAGETEPSYRVTYIPGLVGAGGCSCGSGCVGGDTTRKTVTALVSLQHVDVSAPSDWLVLQNLSAYKAAMMAVKAWEEGDAARGDFYFYGTQAGGRNARGVTRVVNRGGAIPLLQAELRKMTGDRTNAFVTLDESNTFPRHMAGFR